MQRLQERQHPNVYLVVIEDESHTHGHLSNKPTFIKAVNAFLAKNNLPHDAQLASQGVDLLQQARANAQASSARDWIVVRDEMRYTG